MTLPPCQVCGEPQHMQITPTAWGIAYRVLCSVWRVHPAWIFGARRAAVGAPFTGVARGIHGSEAA